ncbi:MAG: hypothetical protein V7782_06045 [Psychromonas sp.]
MLLKVINFLLLVLFVAPVAAVEFAFNSYSYEVHFIYVLIGFFIMFTFILWTDVKDIFTTSLNRYKRVLISIIIVLIYVLAPYAILVSPFIISSNRGAHTFVFLILTTIVAIVLKEAMEKKFSSTKT